MGIKSDLDSNFDFEVVDEFYDHYTMMVESMEVMIIDLSKPDTYQRSVNELFRIFHNIKSASGFLKIEPMRRLSTFVEEVLDELRQKNKPLSEKTINWLLEVCDIFAAWKDDLKNDNELTRVKYSLLKIPDLDED
ncbi:Hpt domain-containing protein [Sulfurimonas sp.]|uniref:Hpt domain-containing protein n=1 Tax=Sulfurimonas sp. TaxID=2022749 RepID=UPI0035612D6C